MAGVSGVPTQPARVPTPGERYPKGGVLLAASAFRSRGHAPVGVLVVELGQVEEGPARGLVEAEARIALERHLEDNDDSEEVQVKSETVRNFRRRNPTRVESTGGADTFQIPCTP